MPSLDGRSLAGVASCEARLRGRRPARRPCARDAGLRALAAAGRAAPVADVAEVRRRRSRGGRRSGRTGRRWRARRAARPAAVVDAEVDDVVASLAQRRDRRVVGVEHEAQVRRRGGERFAPERGDGLDLAVAVELVAKQVGEHGDARSQLRQRRRHRRLVDFEDAEAALGLSSAAVGVDGQRQVGGDAAHQVGAAGVGERPQAGGARGLG